jgi:hypothetical protein
MRFARGGLSRVCLPLGCGLATLAALTTKPTANGRRRSCRCVPCAGPRPTKRHAAGLRNQCHTGSLLHPQACNPPSFARGSGSGRHRWPRRLWRTWSARPPRACSPALFTHTACALWQLRFSLELSARSAAPRTHGDLNPQPRHRQSSLTAPSPFGSLSLSQLSPGVRHATLMVLNVVLLLFLLGTGVCTPAYARSHCSALTARRARTAGLLFAFGFLKKNHAWGMLAITTALMLAVNWCVRRAHGVPRSACTAPPRISCVSSGRDIGALRAGFRAS